MGEETPRLSWWQLGIVLAVASAAVAFVVVVTVGVLADGAGTGNPLDYWRALGRELTDASTWRVVAISGLAGGVVAAVTGLVAGRR